MSTTILEDLASKYNEHNVSDELSNYRDKVHKLYYAIDINFLKNIDSRYSSEAAKIVNQYNSMNSLNILSASMDECENYEKEITRITRLINDFKDKVRLDLMRVVDYADKLQEKIDLTGIDKKSPFGIYIYKKYDALKLFSAAFDLNDINHEMKRQAKRLINIKEINSLLTNFASINRSIYNKNNTNVLINNLYTIISKYIHLLNDMEFRFVKETIKHILAYKYNYIDSFLPTYKMVLNRIYINSFNDISEKIYLICDLNLSNNIYVLNNKNKDKYDKIGYICSSPDQFLISLDITNVDFINIPLPDEITDLYRLPIKSNDVLNFYVKAVYSVGKTANIDSMLPLVII